MSERVTQIVKASVLDEQDTNDYRVVGMISPNGFFAYVETRPSDPNAEWEQDDNATQYQVWESDTPDFMSPVDLATNAHLREWFSGQGYELDTESLTTCCGAGYLWLTCDECGEGVWSNGNFTSAHDFATCSDCGADVDD
jgi:hypothetical protein